MRERFVLSKRLIPIPIPGRVAVILEREVIGYDAAGYPLYRAKALDDLNGVVTVYGRGDRWEPTRPEIAKGPPERPWR